MNLIVYKNGVYVRVIKTNEQLIDEIKETAKKDFGEDNLTFSILSDQQLKEWEINQPKPPKPLSTEDRVAMAEQAINDLLMIIMMGGM